jgi:hypothetical protein
MKSLICLVGVLAVAAFPLRADSDIIGPFPSPNMPRGPFVSEGSKYSDDPLGNYKWYVYEVVQSYWHPAINERFGLIEQGKVRLRFTVHSDGSLSDVTLLEGKDQKEFAKICTDSLTSPEPFKPFDSALIKQVGEKYTDDFTFTVPPKK